MSAPSVTYDQLIAIFEKRFDYQSARSLLAEAIQTAGLKKKDAFDGPELEAIAAGLLKTDASRPEVVVEALKAAAVPPAPAPKAEPPKVEQPKPEDKVEEPPEEPAEKKGKGKK